MNDTILVIEDDDTNMDVMLFALSALGCSAIPALNGPAGLAIAKKEHPGLILCDIRMPHLNGHGVLAGVRADSTTASIPVIAVTSLNLPADGVRLIEMGFDDVIAKPVVLDELKKVIGKHLPRS